MKDVELAAELKVWFNKHVKSPNVWNQTKTGRLIKETLLSSGNWKNKRRGNPKKGFAMRGKNKE